MGGRQSLLEHSVLAIALAATFAIWYASEQTPRSTRSLQRRRELFYWAAILFHFRVGHMPRATSQRKRCSSASGFGVIVFGALIAVVALAYFRGANPVLTSGSPMC